LNELELKVVELGFLIGEPPFILDGRPAGRLEWFRKIVFGFRPKRALADERLEALRAMAAAIRDAPFDPDPRTAERFVEAGWNRDDIRRIQDIATSRGPAMGAAGRLQTRGHPSGPSSKQTREPEHDRPAPSGIVWLLVHRGLRRHCRL
jgi:hypothetical protein